MFTDPMAVDPQRAIIQVETKDVDEYATRQNQIEKYIRFYVQMVFAPTCQLIECTDWSSPQNYTDNKIIRGKAWLKKKSQSGYLNFAWSCHYGNPDLYFNNKRIASMSTSDWNNLFKVDKETWIAHFNSILKSETMYSTVFPDHLIKITKLE